MTGPRSWKAGSYIGTEQNSQTGRVAPRKRHPSEWAHLGRRHAGRLMFEVEKDRFMRKMPSLAAHSGGVAAESAARSLSSVRRTPDSSTMDAPALGEPAALKL